jgi:hypothetical protein
MSATPGVRMGTTACSANTLRCLLGVIAVLTWSSGVFAQTKKASADALFEAAKVKLQAGDWPSACADFQRGFELDPSVSTSIKLARCREHDQKLMLALDEYRRALELNEALPQTPERRRELGELIRRDVSLLESRIPKLLFRITPNAPGLEVRVNGELVPESSLGAGLSVDPGKCEIVVSAPGYETRRLESQMPEGVTHQIAVTLAPTGPEPGAAAVTAAPPQAPARPPAPPAVVSQPAPAGKGVRVAGSGQRTAGLIVGGTGVVALGVAGYFGIQTLWLVNQATPRCPDGSCDDSGYEMMKDASTAQTLGFVFAGAGAALLGTGIVLHATSPSGTARDQANQRRIVARLSVGGASLEGAF